MRIRELIKLYRHRQERSIKKQENLEKSKEKLSVHGFWSLGYYDGRTSLYEDIIDDLEESISEKESIIICNALRRDGFDIDIYPHLYSCAGDLNERDAEAMFRQAIQEFINSPEGRKAYEDTSKDFNWLDVPTYVPDTWLEKYKIHKLEGGQVIALSEATWYSFDVNADEVFAPEEGESNTYGA